MMAGSSRRKYALLAALIAACAPRFDHVAERHLDSSDELACAGFLVWNAQPVRDVFLIINGSGTLSNAFVHPTFEDLMRTHGVAYVTYDKPGITAPFADPAKAHRDFATVERYTLGHGVACAASALRWARKRFGPDVRLHIRAHSEGTLIALYLYDALLEHDADSASAIKTLILSGLALEPFDAILKRQLGHLPDGEQLRAALASCDWKVLRERLGISCAYVADAVQRPSGRALFERLSRRAAPARIHIFHGTNDWNTPVEPVRALEAWSASSSQLAVTVNYYDGAHTGNAAAKAEVARLLEAIVSE